MVEDHSNSSIIDRALIAFGALLVLGFVLVVVVLLVVPQIGASRNTYDPDFRLKIDNNNFPDKALKSYVDDNLDENRDGYLSVAEREKVQTLGSYDHESFEVINKGLSDLGISTLEGIEYFPNLNMLVAQNNQITDLVLVDNPQLTKIDLRGNPQFAIEYTELSIGAQVLSQSGYITVGE